MTSEIFQHNFSQQFDSSLDRNNRSMPTISHQFDVCAAYKKWLPSQRPDAQSVLGTTNAGETENNPSVYEPLVVSLGPYHHGKKQFSEVDEFKHLCLHWCAGGSDERKNYLYSIVLNMIDQVRSCYAEVSIVNKYDDSNLALMMLLDASFIINFMKICDSDVIVNVKDSYNCLEVAAALPFAARDIMLLENQIPFNVFKLLACEIYGKEEAQIAIEKFLSGLLSVQTERAKIPCEYHDPPIHILEACRRILAVENELIVEYDQSNSATCLYVISSVLRQPVSQLVPQPVPQPADVIELQKKGILGINRFANHKQVVNLFQSIDTFNLRNATMYQDVMLRVAEHCDNKAKTCMADLIHGKLNNPWTIIALLSATMLLCLTFLQTAFTIHPTS